MLNLRDTVRLSLEALLNEPYDLCYQKSTFPRMVRATNVREEVSQTKTFLRLTFLRIRFEKK